MSCNWFSTKVYCFHECLLTEFWLFALNISVCTDTEHQGNRYPTARNSASPPETFTQQLNTPGTVTILQGVYASLSWVVIVWGNGLSPDRHQANTWTNAGLLSTKFYSQYKHFQWKFF